MYTVSVVLVDTVNAKARLTSKMSSIILSSTCGDPKTIQASSAYSMPHICTTNLVHDRLQSQRRRSFLQVHQLSEDDHILAEALKDNGQHGCDEDVEQQRG